MTASPLKRLPPERYPTLFDEPRCSVLAIGDSACPTPFHTAALAYYAARAPALVALFCGPGAAHHADLAREHLQRLAPTTAPAVRVLASHDDIDLQLAAEALLDAACLADPGLPALALLDDGERLEAALWRALETEAGRRAALRTKRI